MKKWLLVFTVLVVPACLDSTADPQGQHDTSALTASRDTSALTASIETPSEVASEAIPAASTPCLSACAARFDACLETAGGRGGVCGCRIALAVCQQACGLAVTPPNC